MENATTAFRDRLIAAPLKLVHRYIDNQPHPPFRDRLIAAPLKHLSLQN